MTDDRYRLPDTVVPRHYQLAIAPDLESATFEGSVAVTIEVTEALSSIVCNAAELTIHSAVLTDADGLEITGRVSLDPELERVTVAFDRTVGPGQATLTFNHSGVLNDKLRGFYRSTFVDDEGQTRVIAATQFEAVDARRAFPCWDEPDAKATFQLELLEPEGNLALSNTARIAERAAEGRGRWVLFAPTMRMSTYLAAWVVGPLELTETVDAGGVPLRVACPPGRAHLADFALEVGAHALRWFTEYFALPYPGDKLDLIALPDFAFGAMENLGCVTFRETALLVDPATASREELERVADVVCHEIAHMWFGDLVTMKWWNGIWLNEAFATFMEVSCSDAFRPEWEKWVGFSTARAAAMTIDGLASTRPVEFPVISPDDAEGMFDLLTYQKGGAVLRMLETYLGPERFRDGIRYYLATHSHGNTETTDLWDALEATTGEPVRATMDTWIFQGGHPEVAVWLDGHHLRLSQQRFRFAPDPGPDGARWHVPIRLRWSSGGQWTSQRVLLTGESTALALAGEPDAVVVNDGGWGFFRTRYDSPLLARLTADLAALDAIERFGLVSDAWAGAVAGRTPLDDFVGLVAGMTAETDQSVWEAIIGPLDTLHRMAGDADRPALGAFVRRLLRPAFDDLGWEPRPGEPDRTGSLRATLLSALGTIGEDPEVRARARSLHEAYLADRTAVAPDLAGASVGITAWTGGEAEFGVFLDRVRAAFTPQEEVRYLYALPRFPHPALVRRSLDFAMQEARTQNGPFMVAVALANRWSGPEAWDWVEAHWEELLGKFPDNTISRMLEGIVHLTDAATAERVTAFVTAHPVPNAQLTVNQLLEQLSVRAGFRRRAAPGLGDLLRRH